MVSAETAAQATRRAGREPEQRGETIAVVVPVRDEERTVGEALASVAAQTVGPERLEVLVYDGGSTDDTVAICRRFAAAYPWSRFEIVDNEKQTVQHALNSGLAANRSTWFAVLAGRTRLSPNYLEVCVDKLKRAGEGTGVGGLFISDGESARSDVSRAVAAAVAHPWGVGSGFRTASEEVDVPHHPFAVWRTADVVRFGGFDPDLDRNQDDEFSMRARRLGARIVLTPDAQIWYRPRERFRGLALQYFQYGAWKALVRRRHRLFPLRSAVPPLAVGALLASVSLAAAGRTRTPLLAMLAGYAVSGSVVARSAQANSLLTAYALALVHLSYGTGVLAGTAAPGVATSSLGRTRTR